jgi:hypothetical protein
MSLPSLSSNAYETDDDSKETEVTFQPDFTPARDTSSSLPQARINQINIDLQRVADAQLRLDAEEREVELQEAQAALRSRELAMQRRRQLLRDQSAAPPSESDTAPPAAAVAYTPVRAASTTSATARRLQLSSTVVSQAAQAATLARQQSIEELPDDPSVVAQQRRAAAAATILHGSGVLQPMKAATASEAAKVKTPIPDAFTSVNQQQNREVRAWVAQLDNYLSPFGLSTADYFSKATAYLTGKAYNWLSSKRAEVAAAGKVMTWEWVSSQLIEDFGQASGSTALKAEWKALTMGDWGENDPGTATRTVRQYTDLFLEYMYTLTEHQITTVDIPVVEKYVDGIRLGYPKLYEVMRGSELVTDYKSLIAARDAAILAESLIAAAKTTNRRGPRSTHVNNMYAALDEGEAIFPHEGNSLSRVDGSTPPAASVNNVGSSSDPRITSYSFG